MQYNGKIQDDEEEKKLKQGAGAQVPKATNPAGDGFVTGGNQQEKQAGSFGNNGAMVSNPAAHHEDKAMDSGLSDGLTGDASANVGVREALEKEFGVSPHQIGYDGTHVTLNGSRLVTPADNREGTTYVRDKNEIVQGLSEYARNNGQVAVRDYVNSRGVPVDIGWNEADGTVSINGKNVKPTYVIDGKAYVPQSRLDALLTTQEKETGMKNDTDILKAAEDEYGGWQKSAFEKFMNSGEFSYNPQADASYQDFMDRYQKEVEEEYLRNMAQANFRTGGVASPAAMQMAAAVREKAMDDAAKYVQQFEQAAYDRWQDSRGQAYDEMMAANNLLANTYALRSGANANAADAFYRNKESDWTDQFYNRQFAMDDLEYQGAADDLKTKQMEGDLYRNYAPGIYADEAAVSRATADTAVRQNALGAAYDEPMMQESYSQAVLGTKAAEDNAFWSNLMNQGDFGAAILNAMAQEAKSGVPSGIDLRALLVQAGLLKEE